MTGESALGCLARRVERVAEGVIATLAVETGIATVTCTDQQQCSLAQIFNAVQSNASGRILARVGDKIAAIAVCGLDETGTRARPFCPLENVLSERAERSHATNATAVAWGAVGRLVIKRAPRQCDERLHHARGVKFRRMRSGVAV